MEVDFKLVGKRIKDSRLCLSLSQMQLAERVNISVPYLSNIEGGVKQPSLEILILIANELRVTVDELLAGNQKYDLHAYPREFVKLFADCEEYEKRIILANAIALKSALRAQR